MAGCEPQHLGVVLAAVEAMLDERFQVEAMQVTTNPVAPFVLVNGPRRHELGIACGDGALGPGPASNGVIGRAIRLVLRNIGGATEGIDHSSLGQPAKYTFCLGEDEESLPPGWSPYHASVGFERDDDVVSVIGVEAMLNIIPAYHRDQRFAGPFLHQLGRAMRSTGTNQFFSMGSPAVILSPGHAHKLATEGFDQPRLQRELFEGAKVPLSEFPYGNLPVGSWTEEDGKVLPCASPEEIAVIVAGGAEGIHCVYLQPFCVTLACSRRIWTP